MRPRKYLSLRRHSGAVTSVKCGPVLDNVAERRPKVNGMFHRVPASTIKLQSGKTKLAGRKIRRSCNLLTAGDLEKVLDSTNVATILLDAQLNIRFFTPATKLLFDISSEDIGRPLSDISSLTPDEALLTDAGKVLQAIEAIEREIEIGSGAWYVRRILPYRTEGGENRRYCHNVCRYYPSESGGRRVGLRKAARGFRQYCQVPLSCGR